MIIVALSKNEGQSGFLLSRMSSGGLMFLHDYSSGCWPECTRVIDEFCRQRNLQPVLLPDRSGTAVLTA
jgi:hypothetical protein